MSRLLTARITTENLWLPSALNIPGVDEPLRSRPLWYLTVSDANATYTLRRKRSASRRILWKD